MCSSQMVRYRTIFYVIGQRLFVGSLHRRHALEVSFRQYLNVVEGSFLILGLL